jgi:hypothetical protein
LFITKTIFPVIWFGFLGFFVFDAVMNGAATKDPLFLIVPCVMAVFGFVMMKKMVWDLVDEVYDDGDSLFIKNRGVEERLPLSNVMNVSASIFMNPPRISLRLVTPGKFGSVVSFSPVTPFSLNPFAKNAVAEDLMVRVDQARLQRSR